MENKLKFPITGYNMATLGKLSALMSHTKSDSVATPEITLQKMV
jgi:hypothetical protein